RHEADWILAVMTVVIADPKLLPGPAVVSHDDLAVLVGGAFAGHAQEQPPSSPGAPSASRAATKRSHAWQEVETPLLFPLTVEDDTGRRTARIGHGCHDGVLAVPIHVADQRSTAKSIHQGLICLVRVFQKHALFLTRRGNEHVLAVRIAHDDPA